MREFLNVFFVLSGVGLRNLKAIITYGKDKPNENIVFEKDGFYFYTSKKHAQLRCRLPTKRSKGRGLRRFLRDYVKSEGGMPSTANFWISTF